MRSVLGSVGLMLVDIGEMVLRYIARWAHAPLYSVMSSALTFDAMLYGIKVMHSILLKLYGQPGGAIPSIRFVVMRHKRGEGRDTAIRNSRGSR